MLSQISPNITKNYKRMLYNSVMKIETCIDPATLTTLAERFKWARGRAGLSQAELATLAGVSAGTIGNLEAGDRLSMRKITAAARVLKVDVTWLVEGGKIDSFFTPLPPISDNVLVELNAEEIDMVLTWRDADAEIRTMFASAVSIAKRRLIHKRRQRA